MKEKSFGDDPRSSVARPGLPKIPNRRRRHYLRFWYLRFWLHRRRAGYPVAFGSKPGGVRLYSRPDPVTGREDTP